MMRAIALLFVLLAGLGGVQAVDLPQNRPSNDPAALTRQLEQQRAMPDGRLEGFVHIPDQKAGVLMQPMGRKFRDFRTKYQPWVDAVMIVGAVGAMFLLYLVAGSVVIARDPAGRTIQRFTVFERFIHWLVASTFIWLSLTGLNLVFGRWALRPLIGDDTFASLSALAKLSHNSVGFPFMLGLAVMTVQWMWQNLPSRLDWEWIKAGGGMFGGKHPQARKFNAGQKMIYWLAVFGGGAICVTGLALLTPFYVLNIEGMQAMQVLHSVIAAAMMAVIIGHIYLGTVGFAGSFSAMSTGRVDLNWAREHHGLWLEEEQRKVTLVEAGTAPVAPAE